MSLAVVAMVAVVASALPASLAPRAVAAAVPSLPKPVVAGETIELPVLGQGGVPAAGVDAVVLTVTAVDATAETFITAWPAGEARPVASSLNPGVRRTTANTVVVKVGTDGKIAFYNNAGAVQIVVDLLGWIGHGASLHMQSPARVFDSRDVGAALKADSTTNVTIAGRAGVPVDASAAVVNLTTTQATSESYLSAWPAGAARPTASNVNPVVGRTDANLAVVPIGVGGAISLYNHAGTVDAIVDVLGWLDAAGGVNRVARRSLAARLRNFARKYDIQHA